jgi:5-(carboxyamino)imidazole ribonucleotide synthase
LEIIKNKITQKNFYRDIQIPTSPFVITQSKNDLQKHLDFLPAVHKLAMGGYDGRGVEILKNEADCGKAFDEDAVLEKLVTIKKEISIIVAVGEDGKNALYPPVEMIFNHDLNQLEYQLSPAMIEEKVLWKAEAVALTVVKNLKSPGIFAVELFIDIDDNVLVNETAPRVHNSGHHTIEAAFSSQFDMLWRVILGYPLGKTKPIMNSVMVNLIGEPGYKGLAKYEGLEEALGIDNLFVHIYGKKETRPGRKMGHITVLSNERQQLIHIANKARQLLKVIS